jgi:hypothetical protein
VDGFTIRATVITEKRDAGRTNVAVVAGVDAVLSAQKFFFLTFDELYRLIEALRRIRHAGRLCTWAPMRACVRARSLQRW